MSEEEFNENELLFDELYEKTKDCGRVQFIKLLMEQERENQELKKQLEVGEQQYNDLVEEKEELQEHLSNSHQMKNQQKEFMEYLEEPIKIITEGNPTNISEYTSAKLDTLKEVLQKYKEIIGGNNDQ